MEGHRRRTRIDDALHFLIIVAALCVRHATAFLSFASSAVLAFFCPQPYRLKAALEGRSASEDLILIWLHVLFGGPWAVRRPREEDPPRNLRERPPKPGRTKRPQSLPARLSSLARPPSTSLHHLLHHLDIDSPSLTLVVAETD